MSFLDKLFGKERNPKPEPYTVDTEFGKFTMEYSDKELTIPLYTYFGEMVFPEDEEINGITLQIVCDSKKTFEMEKGLALLRKAVNERSIWIEKAKQYVTENFLSEDHEGMVEIFGGACDGTGNSAFVTVEEYKALLGLASIDIPRDGNIYFDIDGYYKGSSMFSDHAISIEFDPEGNIIGSDLGSDC